MFRTRIFICSVLIAACICSANVQAGMFDLTTQGAKEKINGAWFYEASAASTGTGLIQSFVRIQSKGIEEGFNTDYRPVQYDELTSATFTHSLLLSGVPIVKIDDVLKGFLIRLNEISLPGVDPLDK